MTAPLASKTPEGQICNDIVGLLVRQRHESVTATLTELHSQLLAIYNGKSNKEIATCQVGLALASVGLGDHAEARRMFGNVLKIAAGDSFVFNNTLVGFANIGDIERAHGLALEAQARFAGVPSVLERATSVLEDSLDFVAAANCIDHRLEAGDSSHSPEQLRQRAQLMRDLASRAEKLAYSADDLRARVDFVAATLHQRGRKIFWVNLRGNRVSSVSLEMYVDATPETCAELNYEAAEALFEKFGDRTAGELVPISVRSHVGRPNAEIHTSMMANV